jgi:Methyltransferase domain
VSLPDWRRLAWRAGRHFAERDVVLDHLPRGSVGVELGVWKGDFSARLLRVVKPAKLVLVDPWRFEESSEYDRAWYGGRLAKSQTDMDAIYADVRRRFATDVASGRADIRRETSTEVAQSLDEASIDWVYIDADHHYESVLSDLNNYAPKVKPGGLLAGDDYGAAGWWKDGVTRAVDEFARSGPFGVEAIYQRQFVLRKRP